MAGFSSIVGFMFSFFVIIAVFFGTFFSYHAQVDYQSQMLEGFEDKYAKEHSFDIDFALASYSSDRLSFDVLNVGDSPLRFKEKYEECFDVYVNGKYISKDDFLFYHLNPLDNYYVISPGEDAVISVLVDINVSERNYVKTVSCDGQEEEYILSKDDIDWYRPDYIWRTMFNVVNGGASDTQQQLYNIELNSLNFDFSKATQESISFVLPASQNLILDLTFDEYKQALDDFSRYSNNVYLGSTSGSDSSDPQRSEGAAFGGLLYDGIDDHNAISSAAILQPQKEVTFSSWVKVDNWEEDPSYPVLDMGGSRFFIVNDGSSEDRKFGMSLSVGSLYSDSILENDSWYHLAGTYNGSLMRVYLNSELVGSATYSGDMTYSGSYYVGRSNAGNYFNGEIDEVKVYNMALNESEIVEEYKERFISKGLNYSVNSWDAVNELADIDVKVPVVARNSENVSFELYYYLSEGDTTTKDDTQDNSDFVPAQITDLAGTAGNGEVYLTWSEPNDNGYPITSYTVEYGLVSTGLFDQIYLDDDVPGATITGLTNEKEYQFRVYATNSEGDGPVSDPINSTPSGTFWMVEDLSTDLGVDGTANQGTTPIAYAQLSPTMSADASACISERSAKTNRIMAQEYTSAFNSDIEMQQNVSGVISVDGDTNPITWRATLYEYNDVTGDVAVLGTAQNESNTGGADTLGLTFDNAIFTVASGNRLKVVIDATNGGNKLAELCYGVGTQSSFSFDRN